MDPRRRAGGLVFGSGWEYLGQVVTEGSQSLQHVWGQVEMCQSRALPRAACRKGVQAAFGSCCAEGQAVFSARFPLRSQPANLPSGLRMWLPSALDQGVPAMRLL